MAASSPAPLAPGIYAVDGEAVGSLAPKFRGLSYAFMVTNAISAGSDMQMWCADLVPAGTVPAGQSLAGKEVWALHGHPFKNVFVVNAGVLIECDANWNQRYVWKRSEDLRGNLFREAVAPPVSASSFPTENFISTVVNKDPALNEPYSPSTQTIVEACAYFSDPLSEDPKERQEQLVMLYTAETPLYHEMNQALRDDNGDKMRYFGAYIKELRDVFKTDHEDQIITPFEGTVWRGISFPDAEAAMREFLPGRIFVWPAFTSMSTAKDAAMGFGNLVFEITCCPPPGHYDDDTPEYAPASVEQWSCFQGEHEVLFPPNIKFKVEEIKYPDGENGLVSPLVVCETVGFDTDGGIVEFSRMDKNRKGNTSEDAKLKAQMTQQQEELKELRSRLDACCERVDDCGQRLDGCDQRLDSCCQRLDGCESGVKTGAQGLQEMKQGLQDLQQGHQDLQQGHRDLQGHLRSLPAAETLDALRRELNGCAGSRDVLQLRDQLEREAAARGTADQARQQEEARLHERCDDLQAKDLELARVVSLERGATQQRFEDLRTESARGQRSIEQDFSRVSQQMQAMLAESLKAQKTMEQEVSRLSAQVHEQLCADLRRTRDMDEVLKGLTDKCYMTSMILATEKLKHETLEIKSILAPEPRRAHSSARRVVGPTNQRATLDAAVQGVSDIKNTLQTLRAQFPKDAQPTGLSSTRLPGTESVPGSPRQGAEQVAVGGALQALRAARRPSDAVATTTEQS